MSFIRPGVGPLIKKEHAIDSLFASFARSWLWRRAVVGDFAGEPVEDAVGAIEQALILAAGSNTIAPCLQLLASQPRNLPGDTL